MHNRSITCRHAIFTMAFLILLSAASSARAQCTNVSTRFVGVPATNCILAPLSQQATNPICEVVNDGFPLAYWLVTISNAPSGYSLTNGTYRGWCADYDVIIESGIVYKPIAYLSTLPLPPHLADPNWNRVNYILNHKQGNAFDVQSAIWRFIGGPVSPFDPVFGTLTAAGASMVAQASALGASFIPSAGEVTAVILDVGPTNQLHFVEVACPAILDVCHGAQLTLCTTNTGTGPLTFMWFKNGVAIPGASSSCLPLTGLAPTDSGTYSVRVSNPCSAATNMVSLIISNTADTVPPVIVCASNRTYQCLVQVPPAPDYSVVSATDNSGQVTVTFVSQTITTNGCDIQVVRRYQAADPCGNVVMCDHTDIVRDTTPPVLTGVPVHASFQCLSQVPAPANVTATDNCDTNLQVIRTSSTNGTCPILIQNRWVAQDRCGNGVTNLQLITVQDTLRPTITCPPDLTALKVMNIPPRPNSLADFIMAGGAAGDNCDTNLSYLCVDGPMSGGDCGGSLLRTHTVIDDCTNFTSCVQTINILTSAPPVITCPPALTVQCAGDVPSCPGDLAGFIAAGGTASGNISTYLCSDSALVGGACGGVITRTHRVTDACKNAITCTQTITVRDTTPPVITCAPNLTTECGSTWAFTRPTATDNCSGTNVTIEIVSTLTNTAGFCGNTFSVTRTWRALDACTNAAVCSQTVTLVDRTPPVIVCANSAIVECGAAWNFTPPTATDICGTNVTIQIVSTVTNTAGFCGRTFSATRTWRAVDACTNSALCSQTITVVDTQPPAITCAGEQILECGTPWNFTPPSATDGCDGTNLTIRIVSTVTNTAGFCGRTFIATRTWEALDQCQNRSTCSQLIIVVDTAPPALTCAADRTVECSSTWAFTPPTATDLCDGTNITITIVSTITNVPNPRCPQLFAVTRTWRAADQCNNAATCSQTITLVDTIAPTLICPSNLTFECSSSWSFTRPLAADNCEGTNVTIEILGTITNAGPCGKALSATRTWRAYDSCTNLATCSQTITVVDTQPPVLSCASDALAECGTPWVFTPPFAEDLCDGTNLTIQVVSTVTNTAGFCGRTFAAVRTWRATDACGNLALCNQTITVIDTRPPALTCAPNELIECGSPFAFTAPSATDLCDGTNVTITIISTVTNAATPRCPNLTSIIRTWRATDACGNAADCSQTITISDTRPPAITCAANETIECHLPWAFKLPTAVDLCDGTNVTITILSTTTNVLKKLCPTLFSVTRTWRAADSCNNSAQCSQTITLTDTTPPVITCAPDRTVECSSTWAFTPPTATDLCSGTNVTITIVTTVTNAANPLCPRQFNHTRTWRAADSCGNAATCSQTITTVDTTPPTLTCAQDRTIECSSSWSFTRPFATDNCDGTNVTIEIIGTVTNAGPCGKALAATRTWRAYDSCTNLATCSQTITVIDTTPPVLSCAADAIVECGVPWAFTPPFAEDACDGTNIAIQIISTVTNSAGFCGQTFSVTRTWRAADSCTNVATCHQTIVIIDTRPPVITCAPNQIVECSQPWAFTAPTATDLCDGNVAITIVSTITNAANPRCPNLMSITRTWRAADSCSNAAECAQTITLVDATPPTLTCWPDEVIECSNPWAFTPPSAVDLCDGTNVTITVLSTVTNAANPRCPSLRSITRTWRGADTCGNNAQCSQTITIADTTPPTITCPASQIVECSTQWAFSAPSAVDLCDGTNVTITIVGTVTNTANPRCPNLMSIVRTWRAADSCNNASQCSQTITLVDTQPPTITCASDETVECGNPWAFLAPTATDLCDGTNVTITIVSTVTNAASPRCPGLMSIVRTWRAADSCNNTAQCSQTINLVDTRPPTISCASDRVVDCNTPWAFTPPTAVDLCDANVTLQITGTTTNAGACRGNFSVTRTWRALDSCSNAASCSQTITVVDTAPPVLTCWPDRVVECGTAWSFTPPTAEDLCDGGLMTIQIVSTITNAGSCARNFSVTRTWRALDACSNAATCSQTISLLDTAPPSLTCAPDQIVECGDNWMFTPPSAVDSCDGTNITLVILSTETNATSPRCPGLYSVKRTWRAADSCGNAATCSQTINVFDTRPPTLSCAEDRIVECGDMLMFSAPSAVDICDGTNVTVVIVSTITNAASPRCPGLYSVKRTWRATDTCGNESTCNQTLNVVDTTAPTLTCAADRIIECGSMVMFNAPSAADACDGTNITVTIVSTITNAANPRCPGLYNVKRTWRATDTCGNESTCNQIISVVDTTPPTLTCAEGRIIECGDMVMFDAPSAVDTCDGTNITVAIVSTITNAASPRCPGLYNVKRTWRATDTCGNESTCNQIISVVDTRPPELTCARNETIECGQPWTFTAPTATDVCDGTATITIVSTTTNAACGRTLTATRVWRATDSCGNASTCSQSIHVVDTTPPTLSCAEDRIIECGDMVMFSAPGAVDICDGTNITVTIVSTITNAASPRCPGLYSVKRTWRATDTCGNESTCNQIISVVDTRPPELTCARNETIECGQPWTFTAPVATDICDGAATITIVSTTTNAACGRTLTAIRVWRATDSCSNTATCSQTITVVDTTPPALTCAEDRSLECAMPWAFTAPVAVDLCDGTNLTLAIVSTVTNAGTCPNNYTAVRTWRATDTCGNAATCSQTILVADTRPPMLICAADRVVECGLPWSFLNPSVTDLCDGTNVTLVIVSTATNAPDPNCPSMFSVVRTWRATDRCGNASLCSQSVLLVDSTPPSIDCPSDRIIECGQPWALGLPTAHDLCDGTNIALRIVSTTTNAHPSCTKAFTVLRIWSATDRCGNISTCGQAITVVDTTPPNLTCADSFIIECGQPWEFTRPFADDVCDGTNVIIQIVNTLTNNVGCGRTMSVTRTWRAFDSCTNVSMCSQVITVVDTLPPTLICAADRVVECGGSWNFSPPSANDVCNGTNITVRIVGTVTNNAGFCGRTFSATRTWEAIDACTNRATCSQTITVVDTQPPVLLCAADRTVECGSPWNFDPPTADDLCDTNVAVRITSTTTNFQCGRTFNATRVWEAVDACGNRSTCDQTITVVDTQPPVITCAPDFTVECGQPWNFAPPTATDTCSTNVNIVIVNTVTNTAGLRCPQILSVRRTWRATDACGNTALCSQTVVILDTVAPVLINVPPNASFKCLAAVPPPALVGATDACDPNPTLRLTISTNGACPTIITRTWTAYDTCSNVVSATQTITVIEDAPVITAAPVNATVCPGSNATFCVTATSDCGVSYQWSKDSVLIPGATERCYTVTNAQPTDAGRYCVVVSSPCHARTNCANLSFIPPVEVGLVPTPACLVIGTNLSFCPPITASVPYTCAWYHNGVKLPSAGTNCCLIIPAYAPGMEGNYTLYVTGVCNVASSELTLPPPMIFCGPDSCDDQTVCEGGVFTICETIIVPMPGVSYAYQWFRGDSGVTNFLAGETNACITRSNVTPADAGFYGLRVIATLNGGAITQLFCGGTITVLRRTVADGPRDQMVCAGTNVTFSVTASGTGPFTYMWSKDGVMIPGQTNDSILILNMAPADMGLYCVKVTGHCGSVTNCARLNMRSSLGDFVWEDLNFNGCQDVNEPGISNVVVHLLNCASDIALRTTVTDGTGHYLFDCVEPGDYRVRFFTPSAAWMFTTQTNPVCTVAGDSDPDMAAGLTRCFTLPPGTTDLTRDAGMIRKACLGDFVWEDLNHDGRQDAGEPGIPNVTLRIYDCATSNFVASTLTGPNGEYLFCGLIPGSYRVEIVVPDGYTITTPNSVTNDCADSDAHPGTRLTDCIVLPPGANDLCVDLGLKRFSALGDFVWNDLNRDGRQDAGEPGISNVTVRLHDCATMNLLATQLTDGNGRYFFGGLTGGTYKVTFVAPAGMMFSPRDAVGVPDQLDSDADLISGMTVCYPLPPGTTNLTVDAGLYIPLPPCIDVIKSIACLLPADQCGPFGKTATGYRAGTQNPAFCYSITISNCGGHTLTNLSVMDNKMGDLTTNFFASRLTPLLPGATLTRYYKMTWDVDTTNTVNATARAAADGAQQVSDNDLAIAYVENASVSCLTTVYSPDDQDTSFTDGHVTLIDDGTAHDVTFMVVVCNDGDVDLANVTIRTPGMAALGCADLPPFDLARGACRTNILCAKQLTCATLPLSLTNHVTAHVDTRNNHCGYDLAGSNITARSECHMQVECGMPGSCRVTGGGRQEHYFPADVRYVTHGGQVGAPVGNAGFDPGTFEREGSECIHGNWEHVRHQKGGNRGNFHAKIYDSLMCACLACPEDPLAGVVIGGLCNPDNRTCGPEPRRAPANKICFSGIGDYALTSGNRESRSVLFRVDIEDRSEPGNSHAGGSQAPHDRHRIRIWILTDAEKARLNNRNDRLLDMRRIISCSPGSTALQDGAIGANGLAVPLGTAVFGLRAPDIDDGGEMDHGNHQIHPMIKDCPK